MTDNTLLDSWEITEDEAISPAFWVHYCAMMLDFELNTGDELPDHCADQIKTAIATACNAICQLAESMGCDSEPDHP